MILKNELFWLSRHFKAYTVPLVVYDPSLYWGGYYNWPQSERVQIGSTDYDGSNGIVVISLITSGVIAHEYRHHLQYCLCGYWFVPDGMEDDEALQFSYYKSCQYEHDAIRFEKFFAGQSDDSLEFYIERLTLPQMSRSEALLLPGGLG